MSPFRKWKRHQRRPGPLWSSPHKHPIKVPDNYKPLPSISSRVFKLDGILRPMCTPSNTTRSRNLPRLQLKLKPSAEKTMDFCGTHSATRFELVLHVKWLYLLRPNNESTVFHYGCKPALFSPPLKVTEHECGTWNQWEKMHTFIFFSCHFFTLTVKLLLLEKKKRASDSMHEQENVSYRGRAGLLLLNRV